MNKLSVAALGCLLAAGLSGAATADELRYYDVTVTNVTRGQSFTPILMATHGEGVRLYRLGDAASPELAALAEGGATQPLADLLAANPQVSHIATSQGLLGPGHSVTVRIAAEKGAKRLSMAAMLVPTNDGFFALNGVDLPKGNEPAVSFSPIFDAGSEPNDELCINIPGPACGGIGGSPEAGGEGYVHVHAGIHGIGDLAPAEYDWRNPGAMIVVRRVHE
jgi:hypothetical protein